MSPIQPSALSPVVVGIRGDESRPLPRGFIKREDRLDRTRRHTSAAVDAFVGMNIKHLSRSKGGLILSRMNTVDGTNIHASRVLGAYARLANDVCHFFGLSSIIPRGLHVCQ